MPTAEDTVLRHPTEGEGTVGPRYASFILRCWTSDGGELRARLIDVRSGISRPLADLSELPGLIRQLTAEPA
jgi:hypothetical protein